MRTLASLPLLALALAASVTQPTRLHAQGAKREQVVPQGMSASPTLSPGVKVGNTVYSSGQLGLRRENPDSTIQGQTRIALDNIKKVFEAAGT
ncbi:MAG: RidA family protein, partial [Gemmatimonadaceae bacterium]